MRGTLRILHQRALGDFQLQIGRVDLGFRQHLGHAVHQVGLGELPAGQVDVDLQRRPVREIPVPDRGLLAGPAQHPFADRHDQAGLLGQRDEVQRRQHAAVGMVPAHQRLDADDLAGIQRHDGLVVQQHLVAVQRPAQVILQVQHRHCALVHAGVEQGDLCLAVALRAVHGKVGIAQDILGLAIGRIPHRHADGGGADDLLAVELEWLADRVQHVTGEGQRLVRARDILQQNGEFVAAQPGERVAGADLLAQPQGKRNQQLVAAQMAHALVHDLEAVEVDQQDGEAHILAGAAAARHRLTQSVGQQGAVRQGGQRVVQRVMLHPFLGDLARGDVGLRAGDAGGLLRHVAHRLAPDQHPVIAAIGVQHAVLALEMAAGPGQMRVELRGDLLHVARVDAAEPFLRRIADFLVVIAQHFLPAPREEDAVLLQVPVPQPVIGARRGQRIAFLAAPQGFLARLALGDVGEGRDDAAAGHRRRSDFQCLSALRLALIHIAAALGGMAKGHHRQFFRVARSVIPALGDIAQLVDQRRADHAELRRQVNQLGIALVPEGHAHLVVIGDDALADILQRVVQHAGIALQLVLAVALVGHIRLDGDQPAILGAALADPQPAAIGLPLQEQMTAFPRGQQPLRNPGIGVVDQAVLQPISGIRRQDVAIGRAGMAQRLQMRVKGAILPVGQQQIVVGVKIGDAFIEAIQHNVQQIARVGQRHNRRRTVDHGIAVFLVIRAGNSVPVSQRFNFYNPYWLRNTNESIKFAPAQSQISSDFLLPFQS